MKKSDRTIALRLSLLGLATALSILGMMHAPLGNSSDIRVSAIDIGKAVQAYTELYYIHEKEMRHESGL